MPPVGFSACALMACICFVSMNWSILIMALDIFSFDVILLRGWSVIGRRRKKVEKQFRICIKTVDLDPMQVVD